jgi:hypothetical protein
MITKKAEAPVPVQTHYEILRRVELAVMEELRRQNSSWMPVGTRVSYFAVDEDGQPTAGEWKLECGNVEPLDEAPVQYVDEAHWQAIRQLEGADDPLSLEFVDELFASAKRDLEGNADQNLAIEVAGVVAGSPTKNWGSACTCPNRKKRYYVGTTTYCTTSSC